MEPEDRGKYLLLAVVGVVYCVAFAVMLNQDANMLFRSDLFSRWYATNKMLTEGRSLYDLATRSEILEFIPIAGLDPIEASFFYPAHIILFTGPLALLPYPCAHLIWTICVQVFFFAALWITIRRSGWPDLVNTISIFIILAALFIPNIQHTLWSQFNTVGILSLALSLDAIRNRRYGWAGVWALGLNFKPHTLLLTLFFLIFWAFFHRPRRRFYLGFGGAGLALFIITTLLQNNWIIEFINGVREYRKISYYDIQSTLDMIWNPHQLAAGLALMLSLVIFIYNRKAGADSLAFNGCILLSVGIWSLVIPVLGMLNMIILPVLVVVLLSSLKRRYPKCYRVALYSSLILYLLGVGGLVGGLSSPHLIRVGKHIFWAEGAYKHAAPILLILFAAPLYLDFPTLQRLIKGRGCSKIGSNNF